MWTWLKGKLIKVVAFLFLVFIVSYLIGWEFWSLALLAFFFLGGIWALHQWKPAWDSKAIGKATIWYSVLFFATIGWMLLFWQNTVTSMYFDAEMAGGGWLGFVIIFMPLLIATAAFVAIAINFPGKKLSTILIIFYGATSLAGFFFYKNVRSLDNKVSVALVRLQNEMDVGTGRERKKLGCYCFVLADVPLYKATSRDNPALVDTKQRVNKSTLLEWIDNTPVDKAGRKVRPNRRDVYYRVSYNSEDRFILNDDRVELLTGAEVTHGYVLIHNEGRTLLYFQRDAVAKVFANWRHRVMASYDLLAGACKPQFSFGLGGWSILENGGEAGPNNGYPMNVKGEEGLLIEFIIL